LPLNPQVKESLAKGLLSLILLLYSISLAQKIEDPIAGFWALLVFYSLNFSLIYGTFDEQRVTSLLAFSALSTIVLPAIFLDLEISIIWLIYFLFFVSISLIRKEGTGKEVIIPIAVMLAPLPFYLVEELSLSVSFLLSISIFYYFFPKGMKALLIAPLSFFYFSYLAHLSSYLTKELNESVITSVLISSVLYLLTWTLISLVSSKRC